MVCPKCGNTNIKEGDKFCTKCGTKLSTQNSQSENVQGEEKGIIGDFIRGGRQRVRAGQRREERRRFEEEAERRGYVREQPNVARDSEGQMMRRLTVDTSSVESIDIVQGRAIWSIGRGEVARRVTETELANASDLKGVIVQEGCTGLVYIDGQLVSLISAGAYTFPAKSEVEKILEQRKKDLLSEQKELEKQKRELTKELDQKKREEADSFRSRGVFGEISAFGRGVMGLLFGHKREETAEQRKAKDKKTSSKLPKIPTPKICRVYLVSNRVINLVFAGKTDSEGNIDFAPICVPTKLMDINVGLTMQLQVGNVQTFVSNWLADKSMVSIYDFYNELLPTVETTVKQSLRNFEYQAEGLPESIVSSLKAKIKDAVAERIQGVDVVAVLDITDSSSDFERFRAVERELYCSEKELGYLHRTNEFRNRLEQEQNSLAVSSARNSEDLRQALQAINKDQLLSEDEMEGFVYLLESQKRVREAKTGEEEYEALLDLKRCRLVKDDDIAALQNTLAQGVIGRENITEIMRIQAEQKVEMARQIAELEVSDSRLEHDMATELRKARHEGDLTSAQLETKRLIDAYDDERNEFVWARAFSHRQKEEDYEWQKAERERQAGREQASFEQDLEDKKAQAEYNRDRLAREDAHKYEMDEIAEQNKALSEMLRHEESLHKMDVDENINRDNTFANMSAEQIRAAQLSHLTGDAQVAMANAYSKDNENEILRRQAEKDEHRRNEDMDRMERIMDKMQQGILSASGARLESQQQRYDDQVALKQEYQQQAQHAQSRQDQSQNQALGAVSGVAAAAANNLGAFNGGLSAVVNQSGKKAAAKQCPSCGAEVGEDEEWCGECGQKLK